MAEPVLTTRDLNRALLARQLLLERSPMPLTRALERVRGLQTQYAPSAYIGLWSRLRDFRRGALTRSLEQRRAVQGTLMRSTIHTVSAADFPLFAAGIKKGRQEWWLRIQGAAGKQVDMEGAVALLREQLAGGPRRATELREFLGGRGYPAFVWSGLPAWLDLVRVPPSGTWEQRRADLYALGEVWLRPKKVAEDAGLTHLVRRYLGGFGPATLADIADWAGVAKPALIPIVAKLALRQFRDERGRELLDLPAAPLPDADTPAPVRFLPTWDATLLVHARRTQILPEPYRPLVFHTRTPHSVPTFLVDGAVAGKWRYENGRVQLEPFDSLPRKVRGELEEEAGRLAAFHAE
jgi:hypothetical protein